jgi:hypothetical protein
MFFDAQFAPDDAPTPISSSADFYPDEARDILTLEIARSATEVGPQEAAQAAVMTAVRSLGTLYFAVGFEAAMRALQTIHDAAEGEIMRLSLFGAIQVQGRCRAGAHRHQACGAAPREASLHARQEGPISGLKGPRNPAARCPS